MLQYAYDTALNSIWLVPLFLMSFAAQFLPGLLILLHRAFAKAPSDVPVFPLTLVGLLLLLTRRGTWRTLLLTAAVATAIGTFLSMPYLYALATVGIISALISWERLHRKLHP